MPKRIHNITELVQADFREIRDLLEEKHQKVFTVEYVRKVCNGKRHNDLIHAMALDYIEANNQALKSLLKQAS